ncbi:MAG: dTDP-4-dehydrorhamnose 3,5-epimerase family protein [Candidatus Roizmanbacteria bacterium]|nr:MAG: dTDP-4-dehydrorhamnose 3,5-epimerase family protein [Candidatus Roizmanbacteria bacterium]
MQITKDDLIQDIKIEVFTQKYGAKPTIDGLKIIELKKFSGEDGTFEELLRINDQGNLEIFPDFHLMQVNRSKLLPGAIKAWHIHLNQEDIWYADPEDHMLLGLWDIREDSSTKNTKFKLVLGAGVSRLVYIPRGVAHGVVNISNNPGTVIYFVNKQFNIQSPDEYRLPWDKIGKEFWECEKA